MKNLIKVGVLNLFILNGFLYAQTTDEINYDAYKHGYNLKASQTLSPKDMGDNVRECLSLNDNSKLFYCIVGASEKTSGASQLSIYDMQTLDLSAYGKFVNERINFVKKEDFDKKQKKEAQERKRVQEQNKIKLEKEKAEALKKQKAKEAQEKIQNEKNRAQAIEKKQISASNNFFVGIHSENISEHGLKLGYSSAPNTLRYAIYLTKHSFTNKDKDIAATEIGLELMLPFMEYKLYGFSPYGAFGVGFVNVSERYYESGNNLYLDIGTNYNINEYLELNLGLRIFDKISIGRTYGSDLDYSSTGFNISVNYWF